MYNLADFGSYSLGGRRVSVSGRPRQEIQVTPTTSFTYDPNGDYLIEHAYVQYFVPAERNALPPVVLLHGGGMCGTTWETTPDGRPGWLHLLLAAGCEVHVVDNVERGRAGWCALDGVWPDKPVQRTLEEAWSLFRFGAPQDFAARRAYAGQRFPVAALEAFARGFVPRWTSTGEAAITAFAALLSRFERVAVICHSQGGQAAFEAAARLPDRVAALVAVEPSGFSDNVEALRDTRLLMVYGDFQEVGEGVPNLLGKGRDWAAGLQQVGGQADFLVLPEQGIRGNSHMLMMDDNNAAVLDRVLAWLEAAVR